MTGFGGPNGAGRVHHDAANPGPDRPSAGLVTVAGRAYRGMRRPLYEVEAMLTPGLCTLHRSAPRSSAGAGTAQMTLPASEDGYVRTADAYS